MKRGICVPCRSCLMLELEYEIRFGGTENEAQLENVLNHLSRRKIWFKNAENGLTIKEAGVREFIDYCHDFLNMDQLSFRVENENDWRPLKEIEGLLELNWIDDVIRNKQVVSVSQPIVTGDLEIFGYEILSRFKREDGSLIYPNEIFSAARSRGRLYALDRICRLAAVSYSAQLNKKVFINFNPTSIYSPEFCLRSTMELSDELGIEATQFIFEVVESDRVDDIEHLKTILAYYREKGFQYALDDVGEGYSTLEMLDDLKPQFMKLDMKYVQGVAGNLHKQQVALSFLNKAHEVGAVPLAEGIEEPEDFYWLKEKGYELFQGYLFGKPSANPQLNGNFCDYHAI